MLEHCRWEKGLNQPNNLSVLYGNTQAETLCARACARVCMCVMQEFQEEIAPIKDDVTHMNQLASTFGPHDIQLSPTNLERIDDLNTRWRLLQVHSNLNCLVFNHLLSKASYFNMKS